MIGELLDKAVSIIAPEAGVRRTVARQTAKMLSTYAAADKGRRNRDWRASPGSADLAIIPDAPVLIPRARQLARDSWVAKSAILCASRNVVGRGIVPVATARDAKGKELTDFNRRAEKLFWEWASDPRLCDLEKRQTFWAKQALCEEERVVAGEHFLIWSYRSGQSGVGLRFQSMEADQLYDVIQEHGGNQVRGGVEIDDVAAPVAFHFYSRNPNDYLFRTNYYPVRVPIDRCFHYFKQDRVRQVRGVTMFAPVMPDIRDHASFRSAHLWRARMEACIGAVIKTNTAPPSAPGGGLLSMPRAPGDPGTTPSGLPTFDFVPGMTPVLKTGEEIEFHNPTAAGNNFDPFTKSILRGIAAGLNISYEQLSRDFTNGSYASQRQALLEDRRAWRQEQDLLIDLVVAPMYRLFIQCAFLEGKFDDLIDPAEYLANPARFCEAEYVPDGFEWIDPAKEATAAEKNLSLRLITRKELIAGRGGRLRNTLEQIAEEKKLSEELHISFPEDINAAASMLKGGVIPPGGGGTAGQPGASPGQPPVDPADIDPADIEFDPDDFELEPSFDNETVTSPAESLLPEEPITIAGKGFGSPPNTFGPHDVFDNPQHNPEAAPGGY
jgi:lambda family phage portal protein